MSQSFEKNIRIHSEISTKTLRVLDFTVPYPKSAKTNFPPTNAKMLSKTCQFICVTMVNMFFFCIDFNFSPCFINSEMIKTKTILILCICL